MNTNIQLTVADLHLVKNLINTACTRGAFQADEMRTVGEFYDRLNAFLSALEDQAQAQAQSNADTAEESNQGETQ
jgi:hypothetical protein